MLRNLESFFKKYGVTVESVSETSATIQYSDGLVGVVKKAAVFAAIEAGFTLGIGIGIGVALCHVLR